MTPCANLVLTSEVTDGVANITPVPQGTNKVFSRKAETETLSSSSHLRYKAENKAPQRVSLSKSSCAKSALQRKVNGSSLGSDSGAYAALAPKGATRILSREARTKALRSFNRLCDNPKDEASSRASLPMPSGPKSAHVNRAISIKVISKSPEQISARSARVSAANPDLREFLTNKQLLHTSPSCCEQVGCQLVMVHSVYCRLGPVPATLPNRQSIFNRLSM